MNEIAIKIEGSWFRSDPISDPMQVQYLKRMFESATEVEDVRVKVIL